MWFDWKTVAEEAKLLSNAVSRSPFLSAEKLLGIIAAAGFGGFGGWIYAIVSLLEGGKQGDDWKATRGCSVHWYMVGQTVIGVGGAFAALFGILTLGNTAHATTSSDLTDTPLYFAALCVVGGFVGNRLLVGVGEKMAKQLTDLEKKSTKAMDTALVAETKAENAEAVANQAKDMLVNAWIARDLAEKLEKARETNHPIPEDLRAEAESVVVKLNSYRRDFPTTRILFIVLANLTFALDRADEALAELNELIANRKKAGVPRDEADVVAWYNTCCYLALLSASDPRSRGYTASHTAEGLQRTALNALKESLDIAKQCGAELLRQRLVKVKNDPDLKCLENLDAFKKLVDRYSSES